MGVFIDALALTPTSLPASLLAQTHTCPKSVLCQPRYDESTSRKRALEEELADLEGKLERAEKLVTGLAGERTRWWVGDVKVEATVKDWGSVLLVNITALAGTHMPIFCKACVSEHGRFVAAGRRPLPTLRLHWAACLGTWWWRRASCPMPAPSPPSTVTSW